MQQRIKILEVLVAADIGEFQSALWYAVLPTPLDDRVAQDMSMHGRHKELAVLNNKYYWVMGRIVNPDWYNPYQIKDSVATEEDGKLPTLEQSPREYRFKVERCLKR